MSKFNSKKESFGNGIIAGVETNTAGKYSNYELLRRVTLANLLFESNYYQSSDDIMNQIENLVKIVDPQKTIELALECRFEQTLRHTPLWLLLLVNEYHGVSIAEPLARISTRPDMLTDVLGMIKARKGSFKPIPSSVKKGLRKAFNNYDHYQIAKYKRNNLDISLVDVVNLVHPKPTSVNEKALKDLVSGELKGANTWEVAFSQGADKKETFERMIAENSIGGLATLRMLGKMCEVGVPRATIKKALSQVNSKFLTPLNFLAAFKAAPEYASDLNEAMKRSFAKFKVKGTTIVAIDVSGSMTANLSGKSMFTRLDLAFAMAAFASYVFEDVILVFTAGSDSGGVGKHMVWANDTGLSIFNSKDEIYRKLGGGGIFTHQLCEWLKTEGYAKNADRLVVISDSQDIDISRGNNKKPDTSPYKTSYIIDVSSHTHGIKTGNWTAEITGISDKLFHYIAALENQVQ